MFPSGSCHPYNHIVTLTTEIKRNLTRALLDADCIRAEFFADAGGTAICRRKKGTLEESLKWLNWRALILRHRLSGRELIEHLRQFYRNHPGAKRSRLRLPPPAVFLSVKQIDGFSLYLNEQVPNAKEFWAEKERLYQIAGAINPDPFPFHPGHLQNEYRNRIRRLQLRRQIVARRFRRPFRNNPWMSGIGR